MRRNRPGLPITRRRGLSYGRERPPRPVHIPLDARHRGVVGRGRNRWARCRMPMLLTLTTLLAAAVAALLAAVSAGAFLIIAYSEISCEGDDHCCTLPP